MPNIFKSFLKPTVTSYVFPEADTIDMEEPKEPELLQELEETQVEEELEQPQEELEKEPSVLDFAAIQAEEILADARRRADALVEEIRQRAEEDAQQVKEDARAEGYRQGYGEGLTQARVEGRAKLDEQMQQQAQEFQSFLEKATFAREEMMEQAQRELCDLSIAIAEKVIHISLKSSQGVIARMIQVATEKLKRREWVHIYVGGYTAKELSQITPDLMHSLAGLSEHIKIIPMAEDERGTCIIEMPDEIIDASASTQIQTIKELLSDG